MILVKPSFEILAIMSNFATSDPLHLIELAGRTCYKGEDKMTSTSAEKFVAARIKDGHLSVIEHSAITVKFIVDRGVTHELVRHRLCAFSQESTRYCNYKGGVTFVIPPWVSWREGEYGLINSIPKEKGLLEWEWFKSMQRAEEDYQILIKGNWSPQQARSVLPNSTKTEIVTTANFREWRHILTLRTPKAAHPQMREIMILLLKEFQRRIPVIFEGIEY